MALAYGVVLDHLDAELDIVKHDVTAAEDAYVLARQWPRKHRRTRDDAVFEIRELCRPIRHLLGDLDGP